MDISLWQGQPASHTGTANEGCPSITPYLLEGEGVFPVVLVCPGGGYVVRAEHEAEPIARWLNSIGVSAIVVNYRVAPNRHPIPLQDVQRAIRLVRYHAEEWRLDGNRLGVLGFSAGGHLAATASTHFDDGDESSTDAVERRSSRPDYTILCYAVTSLNHEGVAQNLLGEAPNEELLAELSNERHVTDRTPPAFIWHTADDEAVPVHHALDFASALSRHDIPFDLHVFQTGTHGLGLAEGYREVKAWTALCEAWLKARRIIETHPRFSGYSTVGQLLRVDSAQAVLEAFFPGISTGKDMAWTHGFSLKHLADIPVSPVSPAVLEDLERKLKSL